MKNIILIIMMVFSLVWSQEASAKAKPHKKKPTVSQKKHAAKAKKTAKVKPAKAGGYKSSYLRKKHSRSVASTPTKKSKKSSKSSSKAHSKKKKKHNY